MKTATKIPYNNIVIRKADYNSNKTKMRNFKIGDILNFTFSRNGGIPKKNYLEYLAINNFVWLAEANYGVILKGVIIDEPKLFLIKDEKDYNDMKNSDYWVDNLREDKKYWQSEEKKFIESQEKNKTLFLIGTKYQVTDTNFAHFPLKVDQNAQTSWRILEEEKNDLFHYKDNIDIIQYLLDKSSGNFRYYTTITPGVRNTVINSWREKTIDGFQITESTDCDLDHFIPKLYGGAGIFAENIIPIAPSVNRSKNAKLPNTFFKIAEDYGLKLSKVLDSKEDLIHINDAEIKAQIYNFMVGTISKLPLNQQRKFYYLNIKKFYGDRIAGKFNVDDYNDI